MPDGVFCIDFGSAFTKVSLRRARRTNSDLVTMPDEAEELEICVPSAAVADYSSGQPRYTFGRAATGRRAEGLIKPRPNWKKELFAAASGTSAASPSAPIYRPRTRVEWLILSKEFRQLAGKYQVAEADLLNLRRLVVDAISLTIPQQYLPPPPDPSADVQRLAVEFFRWLRKTSLDACAAHSPAIENPKDWPARITVPAFAPEHELEQHPGTARLIAAVKEAGWVLHAERPVVSEPYANVIGILTQGSNCTRVADMFKNGLLITSLKKPESYPTYRVVVVDVGAFTTDFAVLTLQTGGEMLLLSDVEFDTRTLSVPLGISHLDDSVLEVINPEHAKFMRDGRAADWVKFRHDLYERRQPSFVIQASRDAIGTGPEMDRIQDALANFENQLGEALSQFLATIDDCGFKELILTGGGCALPGNQKAIIAAAQKGRSPFRKVHLPACKLPKPTLLTTKDQIVTPLEAQLQRGGTALGGTSAFFEMIA
jgi:hypothetical protein